MSPATLLVLVPLLPLVGAILTVALGRRLGSRGHLPAITGIAAAAVVAVTLLVGLGRDVGIGDAAHAPTARPVEMITTLWEWAGVDAAYTPPAGSPAAADSARADGRTDLRSFSIPVALRLDPLTSTLLAIITCIGLLVAIYSIGYMHNASRMDSLKFETYSTSSSS